MKPHEVNATPPPPPTDPLIDEVRAIRKAISEECQNDLGKLYERLQKVESQHADRVVKPSPVAAKRVG